MAEINEATYMILWVPIELIYQPVEGIRDTISWGEGTCERFRDLTPGEYDLREDE